MKKVKHIILAMIIIFNCLILSGLLFVFILINKDSERTKEANIAEQNEYQSKDGEGTKYEIIDGKLNGCGWNDWGQLGVSIGGTERYNREERFVTTPVFITDNVKYSVVGSDYIVILKQDGNLYVMGDDNKGQLGDGPAETNIEGHYVYGYTPFSSEPKYIMGGVFYIACGGCTIAAVKDNGELWMWGDNTYGQVGNKIAGPKGSSTTNFSVTKPYLTMQKVKNVRFEGEFVLELF